MNNLLLAVQGINDMWYAMPLIVAASLVYAATRHEQMGPILAHAVRFGVWVTSFMAVFFVLLWLVTRSL
jgi:hypothetical protein